MFLLLFIIKPTARDIACDVFNGPSEFWNDFNKSQKRYWLVENSLDKMAAFE